MNREDFKKEMIALVEDLIPTIGDDYRATDDSDDDTPSMSLTVGADADGWSYQTGDNSYTGGAYGYASWAVVTLARDSDAEDVANQIVSELDDYCGAEDDAPIFDDTAEDAT